MTVEIDKATNELVIRVPLQTPTLSATGKTLQRRIQSRQQADQCRD